MKEAKERFVRKLNRTLLVALALGAAGPALAGEMITNGNFETGTLEGWTKSVQFESAGDLLVVPNNGGTAPISGIFDYALNPEGNAWFAMTDQINRGSYALTQSFTVDGASTVRIAFQLFANSSTGVEASTPPNRDYSVFPNQNVVVDILSGSADAFTSNAADIVATLYGPGVDGVGPNPWISYAFDLGVLAAGTYQFRFAETDNQGFLQGGIDNISVVTDSVDVPEPATLALLGFGLAGMTGARRRRRKSS